MVECSYESLFGFLPQCVGCIVGFAPNKFSFDSDDEIVAHPADVWHLLTSFLRGGWDRVVPGGTQVRDEPEKAVSFSEAAFSN